MIAADGTMTATAVQPAEVAAAVAAAAVVGTARAVAIVRTATATEVRRVPLLGVLCIIMFASSRCMQQGEAQRPLPPPRRFAPVSIQRWPECLTCERLRGANTVARQLILSPIFRLRVSYIP